MLPTRLLLLALGALAALAIVAGPAWAADVTIGPDGPDPEPLVIAPGESVTFMNGGDEPIRLIDMGGRWDSGELAPGDSFSLSFDEAGEFPWASEDGSIEGTVVVEAAGAGASDEPTEPTETTEGPATEEAGATEEASASEDAGASDEAAEPPATDEADGAAEGLADTGAPVSLLALVAALALAAGVLALRRAP